jgi:hypothetical protein
MWQKARKAWIRVIHESDLETLTPILETYPFEVDFIEGDVS